MNDYEAAAIEAAERYGVRVVELREAARHHEAAELLRRVWRADSADAVMNAAMMTAMAYAGNYVVGAYRGDDLIGAAVAFLGLGHLHSHLTGVDGAGRGGGAGVGYALKQHQRGWALARGIEKVCWTYDPLVGRNAYFNISKLGASVTEYLPDFYGALDDGINAGDASDRLYVTWDLASPAVVKAANGNGAATQMATLRAAGATVLIDRDEDGRPVAGPLAAEAGGPLLVAVPRDIEGLRGGDPALAKICRYAVREALVDALAAGYRITGVSRDGYYALLPEAEAEAEAQAQAQARVGESS